MSVCLIKLSEYQKLDHPRVCILLRVCLYFSVSLSSDRSF